MGMRSPVFDRKPQRRNLNYTDRQFDILNERIPLPEVKTNELTTLIRKTIARHDNFNYEIAISLYKTKQSPDSDMLNISLKEAMRIIQDLTPWEIDWTRMKDYSEDE